MLLFHQVSADNVILCGTVAKLSGFARAGDVQARDELEKEMVNRLL